MFSCCSTPTTKIGPTWAEVHAAAQEEEMVRNQALTLEEIVSTQLPGDAENWDVEDSQSIVEPQFEDALIKEEEVEQPMVGEPLTQE